MQLNRIALAALAASLCAGTAAAAPAASDHDQIVAAAQGYLAAFNAKNVDKIMSYYAKDGLFVFDVTPPREYVGWEAYKKDWQGLLGAFPGPAKTTMSELHVDVVGTVGWGRNVEDSTFSDGKGHTTRVVVRVTDVYRKIGGKWLIVQEHVSVPVDLATGKADLLSKP